MGAVKGTKIIYLFRELSKAAEEDAFTIAFATENERTVEVDSDSTPTKDGAIIVPGTPETSISATSLLKENDEKIDEIEDATYDNKLMEIWEADLSRKVGSTGNKYKGKYFQGYISSFGKTSNAEDYVEVSLEFSVNGKGKRGDITVPQEAIDESDYVFVDTTKTGA